MSVDTKYGEAIFKQTQEVAEMFKNSFGIISPNNEPPITIELTFNSFQAKYLKSLPLHHSQKIIKENEKQVVFSLFLVPTYDFIMEILSFGAELIYVEPKMLRDKIINHHISSLKTGWLEHVEGMTKDSWAMGTLSILAKKSPLSR